MWHARFVIVRGPAHQSVKPNRDAANISDNLLGWQRAGAHRGGILPGARKAAHSDVMT